MNNTILPLIFFFFFILGCKERTTKLTPKEIKMVINAIDYIQEKKTLDIQNCYFVYPRFGGFPISRNKKFQNLLEKWDINDWEVLKIDSEKMYFNKYSPALDTLSTCTKSEHLIVFSGPTDKAIIANIFMNRSADGSYEKFKSRSIEDLNSMLRYNTLVSYLFILDEQGKILDEESYIEMFD
ncbi:hypothetical protein [Spongiimicrobium salis]|uniref:hypothetical protein n=1 Tax=Spongiimicrobium salis TaxID=1667022 RepID=UPI00374C9A67